MDQPIDRNLVVTKANSLETCTGIEHVRASWTSMVSRQFSGYWLRHQWPLKFLPGCWTPLLAGPRHDSILLAKEASHLLLLNNQQLMLDKWMLKRHITNDESRVSFVGHINLIQHFTGRLSNPTAIDVGAIWCQDKTFEPSDLMISKQNSP